MENHYKSWNGNSDRFCSQISRNHQRNKREGRITEKYCIRRIIIYGQIREISWFEQFKIACLKPSQYKRLLNLAKGKVILFLAAITLITTILGYGMDVAGFTVSVGGWKNFILNRLPAFELKMEHYLLIRRWILRSAVYICGRYIQG